MCCLWVAQNYTDAMVALGNMAISSCKGFDGAFDEGVGWYRMAADAEAPHIDAAYNLAVALFDKANGVSIDFPSAVSELHHPMLWLRLIHCLAVHRSCGEIALSSHLACC